jgi:cytidylate kinase
MELEGITREEAERRLDDNDRAREAYVHHFYGADPNDLRHYHLALDTTEISLDSCVDLITLAVERD